ncbi:hypothetical protein DPMN_082961 [Dreissena polymorpha]|uniref:Uncharacterized protein n=1 Tax=Dreissena polymorpha TaxID=45954 RepID=A0A9D3YB00_DREPO|nr:hypothetical protein DPMN_082961 [Dreissena polymorpha]
MNLLTKFHEDRTINVASRVKNDSPLGSHVFQANIGNNVASRVKNVPPAPVGHVFKATKTIIKLIQDIIGTNLLTKFYEDRKIDVASRVLTRKNAPPPDSHVFHPTSIIFKLV